MDDRARNDGGFSCLGCGGCLTLFVIITGLVAFAIGGTEWLLRAAAVAIVVAFLIGVIAMERERTR